MSKRNIIGISEDLKTLVMEYNEISLPIEIDLQNIANIIDYEIPVLEKQADENWVEKDRIFPEEFTSEMLVSAVNLNMKLEEYIIEKWEELAWDEDFGKEELAKYFHVAFLALMRNLAITSEKEELEKSKEEDEESEDKKIVVRCPNCLKLMFCNEHGDRAVYCGNGKYDHYVLCPNCGNEFLLEVKE